MKTISTPQWEFKYIFRDDRMASGFFNLISGLEEFAGYRCRLKEKQDYYDYYFDSSDLKLESQAMVCRVRRYDHHQSYNLAIKRQALGPNREVIYHQTEPIQLTNNEFLDLQQGRFPNHLNSLFRVLCGNKKLEHLVTLKINRTILALQNNEENIAFLNLDHIKAMLPGSDQIQAVDFEVELKSSKEFFPEADMIGDYLRNAFGLIPVTRSKFRRLIRIIQTGKETGTRKVILDMDTGVDDALAIMLAINSPEIEVLGITTVGGNVDVGQSALNTLAVLEQTAAKTGRYQKLPPVGKGLSLIEGKQDASNVHGPDGLGGVCRKYSGENDTKDFTDAADLFQRIISENDSGTVTLITTGPLTNVGHWIETCPDIVAKLKGIITMGGVFFDAGNRSEAAEFNVHSDPSSARRVVEFCRKPVSAGGREWKETIPLTFVGLDVTHRVRFRRQMIQQALKSDPQNQMLTFIKEITGCYMDFYYRNEGLDGCYLHDPLAVAYFINPSLCQAEQYIVEIEDSGVFTSGMTVADYRPTRLFKDKMKEVTWVCYKVDAHRFEKFFLKRVLSVNPVAL